MLMIVLMVVVLPLSRRLDVGHDPGPSAHQRSE